MSHTLLLVGAGTLAEHIAVVWRRLYPDALIIGETRTSNSHKRLQQAGIHPALVSETDPIPPFVVFCAPVEASTTAAYVPQLSTLVSRLPHSCRMVYTSSGSVHGLTTQPVTETTPHGDTPRAQLLSSAESTTLSHPNAAVIRLSALYDDARGPHFYMTSTPRVNFPSTALINMVHYSDVAQAIVKILLMPQNILQALPHRSFIAAGTSSITVEELTKLAIKIPGLTDRVVPQFTEGPMPSWKKYNPTWSIETLSWHPRFPTFAHFVRHKVQQKDFPL